MPYYAWRGVTLQGTVKRGKQYALSPAQLDAHLLKRDIALLSAVHKKDPWVVRGVPQAVVIELLENLGDLIKAGVLLPDALVLLSDQAEHPQVQRALQIIADDVHKGISLSDAMRKHGTLFNHAMVQMAKVGQETNAVDAVCSVLSDHFQMLHNFRKQVRSAALMPCLTFGFFLLIAALIFVVVIPKFADLFHAMHHELPPITKLLIGISASLRGWPMVMVAGAGVACIFAFKSFGASERGRQTLHAYALRIPLLNALIKQSSLIYFLRSAAMLVEGGVPLVAALHIAQQSVGNSILAEQCATIAHEVESGAALSQAMAGDPSGFFEPWLISLVRVAEESGTLSAGLHKAAHRYHAAVQQSLSRFSTLFQPLLMIVMGLMVTALVFAVYLPIINLARVVG